MGCTNSVAYTGTNFQKPQTQVEETLDPKTDLTEKERQVVKSTWKYMTTDLSVNGLQVFLRLFELCPEAKKIFQVENVRLSVLAKNQVITDHGTRFMNAIGAAIDSLNCNEDGHDKLNKVLFILGQKHKQFSGFKPEYFEVFYEALMWRWGFCMGNNFATEVSETWRHVFLYMLEKLKEGYFSQESQ